MRPLYYFLESMLKSNACLKLCMSEAMYEYSYNI